MKKEELKMKDWKEKKFSQIFKVQSSKRVLKKDWKKKGVPFYRAREVVKLSEQGYVDNDLFISEELFNEYTQTSGKPKKDDIIISAVGTLGKCYIVKKEDKFYFKDASVLWLEKKDSNVDSRFIKYGFNTEILRNQIINNSLGATVGTLTIVKTRNLKIPLPPLHEQRRIVSKLDALFAEIDASLALIDQNIEQAEALMGSYLDQEFDKAKTENIPLKKLSNKVQYGYTGKSKEKGEYYYLRITDIQDGRVDYSQAPFSDISKDEVPKYLLKKGDILFARTGATAGKSYLFNDEEDAVFASYLIRVDAKREVLSPEYLKWFFQSDNYWAQIFGSIVGAAQPNFNGTKLKNMIIPVPKMDVQLVLAEKFNAMNKEIEQLTQSYIQKRANLEALKSSLLDSAFKGEL